MTEPLLAAERISVRLGGAAILREVSLELRAGEVLGVFGPSGAGKSTLFRALAGEERPVSGTVRLGGSDVTRLPLWQRARLGLGYLPQTPSVLWDLTVAENLAVFRSLLPVVKPPSSPCSLDALAERIGLSERLAVRASSLSGGERRRLELGRALVAGPRVLLCDEPFAAIDPRGTAQVGERLLEISRAGGAVIIADHHVAEALRLCHRAALLLEGEIALVAPPDAFRDDPLVRRNYAAPPI